MQEAETTAPGLKGTQRLYKDRSDNWAVLTVLVTQGNWQPEERFLRRGLIIA